MLEDDTDTAFAVQAEIDTKGNVLGSKGGVAVQSGIARAEEDQLPGRDGNENTPLLGEGGGNGGAPAWEGAKDFEGLPWYKRPSIFYMLGPFFLMTLAFGGIIAPKLNLLLNLICREYISEQQSLDPGFTMIPVLFDGSDNEQCRIPEVQARVARFTLYGNLIAGLLSAITSPKLGALSDRYGRTKMLMITSMGTIAGDIITVCAATNPETFPVNWILLGFALDGICGSFIAAMAIANAYASDCTPPALRNVAFGYFHACLFTGIALGPILAAFIIKVTESNVSVFYVALGVHAFFILFLAFVVPESLSKRRQRAAKEKHNEQKALAGPSSDFINQIRAINLFEPLKILWPTGEGSFPALRRNLVFLAAVDTILFGVAMGSMTVIIIYTNYEFGWGTYQSSIFMSVVNCCRTLGLIVVLPTITRLVRGKNAAAKLKSSGTDNFELAIIRTAVFFDTLGYLGYALARTGPLMILSGAIASIGGIGSPTLQAALTKHVPSDRTGQLLGASGLLHALARVVAPTIFNAIYAATVGKFTQTVFVCLTCTFGVAFILSWFVRPHVYLHEAGDTPPQTSDGGDTEIRERIGA